MNARSGQSCFHQKLSSSVSWNLGFVTKSRDEKNFSESTYNTSSTVRTFDLPIVNLTAASFDVMVDMNSWQQQPPAIEHLSYADIEQC